MKKRLAALSLVLAASAVGCQSPAPELPPAIRRFAADKQQVNPGETVTLSWEIDRALELALTDQTGTVISTSGDAQSGSATVTPSRTSYYVLRAKGEGGRDTSLVQVRVGDAVSEAMLVPVPAEISGGEEAELIWSAPGATEVVLTEGDRSTPLLGTSGVARVSPGRTTRYTLSAKGGGKSATAEAVVGVHPAILTFRAVPPAARPDQTLAIEWTTSGATALTLTENTFGELASLTKLEDVDQGVLRWKVPASLPNGQPTPVGLPLLFRLTVKSETPAQTQSKTLNGYVGDGPAILFFDAPQAVTAGKSTPINWRTVNAYRVTLRANGRLLAEPVAGSPAVSSGGYLLPPLEQDTTLELTATSYNGLVVSAVQKIRRVAPPVISRFTLTPAVNGPGDSALANWGTQNASRVRIRVQGGAAVHTTESSVEVASGGAELYPVLSTTFVLEASNEAGDIAVEERRVDVAVPGKVTISPELSVGTTDAMVTWDLRTVDVNTVIGAPSSTLPPFAPATQKAPVDLGTPLTFRDRGESVATLNAPSGFAFPFLGQRFSTLYVSTNGFVSFANVGSLPDNVDLNDAKNTAPALLAPFWDDLELGDGRVHYVLDGVRFPRRLTIEWENVRVATDPTSSLTFQLQLLETGEFRFVYSSLSGAHKDARGEGATIGAQLKGDAYAIQQRFNRGGIKDGEQLTYFATPEDAVSGSFALRTTEATVYTLFFRNSVGKTLVAALPIRVFQTNTVRIDEVMARPSPDVSNTGAWVELTNAGDQELDLGGLELRTQGSTVGYTIPFGTRLAPRGILVLGQSKDPEQTGGVRVDQLFTDLPFADNDTLTLGVTGIPVSSLSWTTVTPGTSLQPPEPVVDASGPVQCERKQTFGNGSIGTPGAKNETCFEYRIESIPVRFTDISGTGEALLGSNGGDESLIPATLRVPFTYFGEPRSELTLSTNGWLGFRPYSSSSLTNRLLASPTSEPVGVIAPFWDDLTTTAVPGSNIYMRRFEDEEDAQSPRPHTVIQWSHYTHFGASPNDDLNFQAKLFDDGAIEFHYAQMTSTNTLNYANGNSATVWIERPSGSAAFFVGRNQPVLQPFTAYRFTPRP